MKEILAELAVGEMMRRLDARRRTILGIEACLKVGNIENALFLIKIAKIDDGGLRDEENPLASSAAPNA